MALQIKYGFDVRILQEFVACLFLLVASQADDY